MNAEYELAKQIVEQGKHLPNGCIVAKGAVDDKGFIHIVHKGKKYAVHKFVKVYGVERDVEQYIKLFQFKWYQSCGLTVCINQDHIVPDKPEKKFEELVEWWKQ